MTKALVSIIVPVYNVASYLPACLDSLLAQTYKNIEILVVDDGSTDNCPQLCDEYAAKDKRIKVIHQTNGGLSAARNAGLDHCSGDYIAFVDSDDSVDPNFVETTLEHANGDTLVVFGYYVNWNNSLCEIHSPQLLIYEKHTALDIFLQNILHSNRYLKFTVWLKLYPKKCFATLRFPVGKNYEDIFIFSEVMNSVEKVVVLPRSLYHYTLREGSISHTHSEKNIKNYLEACEKLEQDLRQQPKLYNYAKLYTLFTLCHLLGSMYKRRDIYPKSLIAQLTTLMKEKYPKVEGIPGKMKAKCLLFMYAPWLFNLSITLWRLLKK